MLSLKKIRKFILKQREIGIREGEHNFADKMRKRYNKTAEEFYSQFAKEVFYTDLDGDKYNLDIQTLWWFRFNEMESINNINNNELLRLIQFARIGSTITSGNTGNTYWKFDIDSNQKVLNEFKKQNKNE